MPSTIRRNLALREYDVKEFRLGKPSLFSIKFVKKNGELVFVSKAIASGLPFHLADSRMRGVMPGGLFRPGKRQSGPSGIKSKSQTAGIPAQIRSYGR